MSQTAKITDLSPLLLVRDLEHAIEFYTSVLGFTIDFRYEDFYAGVIRDEFTVHLKLGHARPRGTSQSEDLDITFSVDDVAALYEEFKSRSVSIVQPLRAMPYGKEFYVADPDGYVLSFLETGSRN